MTPIIMPDGKRLILEQITGYSNASAVVTVTRSDGMTAYSFTASSTAGAEGIIKQLDDIFALKNTTNFTIIDYSAATVSSVEWSSDGRATWHSGNAPAGIGVYLQITGTGLGNASVVIVSGMDFGLEIATDTVVTSSVAAKQAGTYDISIYDNANNLIVTDSNGITFA